MGRWIGLMIWIVCLWAIPSTAAAQNWERVGTIDGVEVSKKEVDGSGILAFRGEVVKNVPIGKIIAAFLDPAQRKHWVDRYEDHRTLKKSPTSETYWIHFGAPFPVSDRDYVLQADAKADAEKKVFVSRIKSVTHPKAPENDCCVRATANGTYYRFEALPGGKTKMMVEVHTDPKGMLPNWLVNLIQKKWPANTLNNLAARASKLKAPHPAYADWH